MTENMLIEDYLTQCGQVRRLDSKTVRAYRCYLGQYLEWSGREDADLFSRATVRAYLVHLNGSYAPASTKRKVAALRAFMSWAEEEGVIGRSPFDGLRLRVREPKRLLRTIPAADFDLLFHDLYAAGATVGFSLARDRAIMEVLIASGMRVSELCALDVGSVDMVGRTARIEGKGDKERTVQLEDGHTLAALEAYLSVRGEKAAAVERALFVNRLGTRMSDRAVHDMVDRRSRAAGLSAHVTPHMFRHTFATLLLEGDVDICYIQKLLGHSSISTTEIYAHVTSAKLREIVRDSNPRRMIEA